MPTHYTEVKHLEWECADERDGQRIGGLVVSDGRRKVRVLLTPKTLRATARDLYAAARWIESDLGRKRPGRRARK
ncbi:MAG: hypothetical protein NUW21_00790 [Elusimicrobia bacterium]|nr:hypothetical protein [Elusimicrobiota bacterium]